jgi:hypothetical protein
MRHGVVRVEPIRLMAFGTEPDPLPRTAQRKSRWWWVLAAAGGLVAGGLALAGRFWALGLSILLAALGVLALRYLLARRGARVSGRHLCVNDQGIAFEPARGPSEQLLAFGRPFGVTLFGNRARDRLVMAVTTTDRAVYLGARIEHEQRPQHRSLLSSASTVSDDEAVLDATGPDGKPLEMSVSDLSALLQAILRADGSALERCFLSDTRGAPVVLDGNDLRIGRKGFDLGAPLEWRATLFQEPFGVLTGANDWDRHAAPCGGVMVYQATWIRQGFSEAVLVSLLASLTSASSQAGFPTGEMPDVQSAVLRDLRLMQASPEPPPPRELRVGIERAYMLRLRAALDRAPRASQKDVPSGAAVR